MTFSGETKVITPDGYQPLKSLLGQELQVWTGRAWGKTAVRSHSSPDATVRVKSLQTKVGIAVSPCHRILLKCRKKPSWMAAQHVTSSEGGLLQTIPELYSHWNYPFMVDISSARKIRQNLLFYLRGKETQFSDDGLLIILNNKAESKSAVLNFQCIGLASSYSEVGQGVLINQPQSLETLGIPRIRNQDDDVLDWDFHFTNLKSPNYPIVDSIIPAIAGSYSLSQEWGLKTVVANGIVCSPQ